MSISTDPLAEWDEDRIHELAERGREYYRKHLQSLLEPEQNGKGLAIYPDTGEYVVAANTTFAGREMRAKHPEGEFVVMTIGPEPNYALAARFLAGKQARVEKKQ